MLLEKPLPPACAEKPEPLPSWSPIPPWPPVPAVPPVPEPVPPDGRAVFHTVPPHLSSLHAVWPAPPPVPVSVVVFQVIEELPPTPPSRSAEAILLAALEKPARPPAPTVTVNELALEAATLFAS